MDINDIIGDALSGEEINVSEVDVSDINVSDVIDNCDYFDCGGCSDGCPGGCK